MRNRDLALASRKEDTREKKNVTIVKFELNEIRNHFDESLNAIQSQFPIADDLIVAGREREAENIWRGQIVFIESAFDFFMHELTKYGLLQIYDEKWSETEKYQNMQVKMRNVSRAMKEGTTSNWFLEYINKYFENITLVSFESFKDQMNLLGIKVKDVADSAFYDLNSKEKTTKKLEQCLNQLYLRRNMIAHQFDRKHEDAQIQEVSKEMVITFISDIKLIVDAVHKEMNEK